MGASFTLTDATFRSPRHATHYWEIGPVDGPLMIASYWNPYADWYLNSRCSNKKKHRKEFACGGWICSPVAN